jgi:septal ring factor EnvC (AmiA/AmiB activator)
LAADGALYSVLGILLKTLQNMPVLISRPLVTSVQKILCEHTKKHRCNMMRLEAEEVALIEHRDKCQQANYDSQQHLERAKKQAAEEANAIKSQEDEIDKEIDKLARQMEALKQRKNELSNQKKAEQEIATTHLEELKRLVSNSALEQHKLGQQVDRNRQWLKQLSSTATNLSQAVCAMQYTCTCLEQAWGVLWAPAHQQHV